MKKICTKCNKLKSFDEYYKNKTLKFGLRTECKLCTKKYNKKRYIKNRDYYIYKSKEWQQENEAEYKKWRKINYNKKKQDPLYKLEKQLRKRLWQSFKNKKWRKDNTFVQYIGCTFIELKLHIESQFRDGMTWENWSINGWHIDHIIPLSSAKTKKELIKLQHYTNLQPLWAKENLAKYNKVI